MCQLADAKNGNKVVLPVRGVLVFDILTFISISGFGDEIFDDELEDLDGKE